MLIERFELSIVRVLRPLRIPIPPYEHLGCLMGFEPILSVPQTDVLTINTINTICCSLCEHCSSIRTRTLTFSSVVKGAIQLHHRTILHPLKDSNFYLRFWRPICYHCTKEMFVGIERLELSTPAVSERCSNQLSYIPICRVSRI